MKEDNVFIINLYVDLKNKVAKVDTYQLLLSWFEYFNCQIEYRSGANSRLVKFCNDAKFHSYLSKTNACSFHGGGNYYYEGELDMFKWEVFVQFNFVTGEFIFAVQENLIDGVKDLIVSHIIEKASEYNYQVYYGYAFSGERVKSLGYSSGVLFYDMNDDWMKHNELAQKVKKWTDAKKSGFITEKFRNIYLINIFSEHHISFTLDGMSVKSWILKNKPNNIITICNNLYLWTVSKDEIDDVKEKFILQDKIWEL